METLESQKTWIVDSKVKKDSSYDDILKTLLKKRGVKNFEEFLNPELKDIPPHSELFDSLSAAKKIVQAVKDKKTIAIYGDYDVDGITGTSILWSFLYFELLEILKIDKNDIKIIPYIPDRVEEGYGLSTQSIENLREEGIDLVITVDCGIRDKELIQANSDIEFIITDHHIPPENFLEGLNYTVVHQLYPDKEYPYEMVCGAFISYMLVLAIKGVVGLDSSFEKNKEYLDLVALATVADIIPLKDINRILVKYGLEVLKETKNIGIRKLAEVANISIDNVNTYHLGFVLGPRLNASGRLDLGMHALKLLCTRSEKQAEVLAKKLNNLNYERQEITKTILDEAKSDVKDGNILLSYGEDWNEGVLGLVASRLQEEYYKPTIVFSRSGEYIKGSARSIPGINITSVLEKFSKYLVKFGGHSQAAGLTLEASSFEDFSKEILKYADKEFSEDLFIKKLEIDAVLDTTFLNIEFVKELSKMEPFGFENKKPLFLLEKLIVAGKKVMGSDKNHMRLTVKGDSVGMQEAVLFNCLDDVGKISLDDEIDLCGYLEVNEWNGESKVQFQVKEWRYCNNEA